MKILIQDVVSEKFLKGFDTWVDSADNAEDFFTPDHARSVAEHEVQRAFRILLYYGASNQFVPVP